MLIRLPTLSELGLFLCWSSELPVNVDTGDVFVDIMAVVSQLANELQESAPAVRAPGVRPPRLRAPSPRRRPNRMYKSF